MEPMKFVHKSVVIVGGGFSGTVLAAQLLRRAPGLSIAVIDKNSLPARGLAYGTEHECHLLNVPAKDMSAFPEEPDHFFKWARQNHEAAIHHHCFLPRPLYGRYLHSLLHESQNHKSQNHDSRNTDHADLAWIRDEAVWLKREGDEFAIRLGHGSTLLTRTVVLALGNFPPGNLGIPGLTEESPRYKRVAWSREALTGLSDNDSVLLIGSGLTSVDIALALRTSGFHGKIHVLSRHGLLPLPHGPSAPWPRFWRKDSLRTTRALMRLIREQAKAAHSAGADWRSVVDSLRPHVEEIWQSLPVQERRRFLRHARAYWEVHRHRIAPAVADNFSRMIDSGQVVIHAGRVLGYSEQGDAAEVTFRNRSAGAIQSLRVARVINCSGPETDCRKIASPLLGSLFEQGLVRRDILALGLDVSASGAAVDSLGQASQQIFVLGPMRKGMMWETTAVPELRVQAADLANCLASAWLQKTSAARETGVREPSNAPASAH